MYRKRPPRFSEDRFHRFRELFRMAADTAGGACGGEFSLKRHFGHLFFQVARFDRFVAADTKIMIGAFVISKGQGAIPFFRRFREIMATGGSACGHFCIFLPCMVTPLTIEIKVQGVRKFNRRPFCGNRLRCGKRYLSYWNTKLSLGALPGKWISKKQGGRQAAAKNKKGNSLHPQPP